LLNASGKFVAPNVASMTAALGQTTATATDGVVRVASEQVSGDGYPLTRISYGVTNPALLDQAARADYANFAKFAATDGQVPGTKPGQLPIGYAPLPQSLRNQALSAAERIRTATAPTPRPPTPTPSPSPSATGASSHRPTSGPKATHTSTATSAATAPLPTPAAATPPATAPTPSASASPSAEPVGVQRVSAITPAIPVTLLRWLVPALAGLGLMTALVSRFMIRRGGP
jgi:hypothetical protein